MNKDTLNKVNISFVDSFTTFRLVLKLPHVASIFPALLVIFRDIGRFEGFLGRTIISVNAVLHLYLLVKLFG